MSLWRFSAINFKAELNGLFSAFQKLIKGEAFKKMKLTMKDIENAVKSVRRKAYEKKR